MAACYQMERIPQDSHSDGSMKGKEKGKGKKVKDVRLVVLKLQDFGIKM